MITWVLRYNVGAELVPPLPADQPVKEAGMPFQYICETCGATFVRSGRPNPRSGNLRRYCSPPCQYPQTPEERFWAKAARRGSEDCWLWTGSVNAAGYGTFAFHHKNILAHRFSFFLAHGHWPNIARHDCDTPACVNPAHIRDGTRADNVRDAVERGLLRAGEKHVQAKLTDDQVREIRSRYAAGGVGQRVLAREYGVSGTTIHGIVHRTTWRYVH